MGACSCPCVSPDLLSTWGDGSYVGLCGLQLLGCDAKGALLPLDPAQIKITIGAVPCRAVCLAVHSLTTDCTCAT